MEEMFGKLTKMIQAHDNFIIMAHKSIDLDAFGSALCLHQILKSFEKPVKILMADKQENNSIAKSIQTLENHHIEIQYTSEKTVQFNNNTLIFILDTNKKELLEYPGLLSKEIHIAIIDHHIAGCSKIENPIFNYIDAEVSSTSEIMVRYLKYLGKKVETSIATILLAGLVIDTNNFNIKTSAVTYETAAMLTRMGADNIEKQQLLKEDKESYVERQTFVKNSYMVKDNIALCIMDHKIYKNHDLALISEDLLQFDGVEASFTIGFLAKKQVGISARSIGTIDVEQYMRALGGGGHKTDAACVIKTSTLDKVKKKLIQLL